MAAATLLDVDAPVISADAEHAGGDAVSPATNAASAPSSEPSPFAAPESSPFAAPESSPFAAPPADASGDAAVAAELAAFAPVSSAAPATPVTSTAANASGMAPAWDAPRGDATGDLALDVAAVSQSPFKAMLGTLLGSRRNMAIAGGAVVLLIVVLAVALGGGKSKSVESTKTVANRDTPKAETPVAPTKKEPEAETPTPTEKERAPTPTETAAAAEPSPTEPSEGSSGSADAGSASPDTSATPQTAAKPTGPKVVKPPVGGAPKKTLGGKQLVLEYDAQAKEAAKPVAAPKNDQAAILKARASYAQGNQRLLAGDWNGAILKYRQSLASYPGYVAGYRGLGLAFMQMGDKPKALQAFRLYISSVPSAKDAAIIRKRIQQLEK